MVAGAGEGSVEGRLACADEALRVLQQRAYYAARVDWSSAAGVVERAIRGAAQLGTALRPVFRALGDRHSFLRSPGHYSPRPGPLPTYRLEGGIGYLGLPGFRNGSPAPRAAEYVEAAWRLLRAAPRVGVVIDMRDNTGGNIVPMLTAVGPVLGAGRWLRYTRRDHNSLDFDYTAGELLVGGRRRLAVGQPPAELAHVPVAILVGSRTASAAEVADAGVHAEQSHRFCPLGWDVIRQLL